MAEEKRPEGDTDDRIDHAADENDKDRYIPLFIGGMGCLVLSLLFILMVLMHTPLAER